MASATSIFLTSMKSRRSFVVSLALLLFLSFTTMLLNAAALHERLKTMRGAAVQGGGSYLVDLDVAYDALVMAADDLLLSRSDPEADSERSLARLTLWFDRFSQSVETAMVLLSDPDATPDLAEKLVTLDAVRSALAGRIDAVDTADGTTILAVTTRLRTATPIVQDITAAGAVYAARAAETARQAERSFLRRFWIQNIAAFAAMMGVAGLALWLWHGVEGRAQHLSGITGKAFDSSVDAVIIADADGRILLTNQAASRMFGVPGDGLAGYPVGALTDLQDLHANNAQPGAAVLPPQVIGAGAIRVIARRPNGPSFPADLSVTADNDLDGRPILIVFIRDMTAAAAAADQLRTDREAAERNAAAKTAFLGMMSHDMRTPLQGMIAALDLLDQTEMDQTDRNLVQTARDCSLRALQQINDVLEMTRLNGQQPKDAAFDPTAIVAEILGELTPLAAKQKTQLSLRVDHGDTPPPPFVGAPAAFARAIYNLVGNAVKFTVKGHVTVALTFRDTGAGKFRLDVAVVDTGIGIALEKQDSLFEEFKMLNGDHAHLREGAGLGLVIANAAVKQMNGTLGLTSSPGEGSTFSFGIDLSTAAVRSPDLAAPQPTAQNRYEKPSVGPRNILVVDDNAINLGLLAAVVRQLGHTVDEASDGSVAVGLAAMQAYDVILMDVSMPVMDGYTASRIIRAGGPSCDALIVAVTAYADIEHSEAVRHAGIDAVLTKPATQAEIAAVLEGRLPQKTVRAPAPVAADPERTEVQRAVASLSETLGDDNAIRLMKAGLKEVTELLNALDADPDADDQVAAAIHRIVGSTAVLGFSGLSQALSAAEQAAHARDRQRLWSLLATIKSDSVSISSALAAHTA
jgi:PAS domain S-box-containing protein